MAVGGGTGHGVKIKVTEIGLESLKHKRNCDASISNGRTLDNERHCELDHTGLNKCEKIAGELSSSFFLLNKTRILYLCLQASSRAGLCFPVKHSPPATLPRFSNHCFPKNDLPFASFI